MKTQRLFRMTAALVAALMVMAGLSAPLVAAQDGVTGATSYESPKFGYEVDWTSDWEVIEAFTVSGETTDSLRIFNSTLSMWVDVWGFEQGTRTVTAMLNSYFSLLENSPGYANVEVTEQDSLDPSAVAAVVNYELGDNATRIEDYVEVRPVGGAFVLTSVKSSPGLSLIAAVLASGQVQINGAPIFPSAIGPADSGGTSGGDNSSGGRPPDDRGSSAAIPLGAGDGTYIAPTYGVFFEFDADFWEVADDLAAADNGGRDMLRLRNTDVPAQIYFETYTTITRAAACLESASDEAYGDADFDIFEDDNGDEIRGSSRGVAYAAYIFEASNGTELVAYVECRALPNATGVFVITLFTLPSSWDEAFSELTLILDTVALDGDTSGRSSSGGSGGDDRGGGTNRPPFDTEDEDDDGGTVPPPPPVDDEDDDSGSGEDRGSGGRGGTRGSSSLAETESPTYGVVLSYDDTVWEIIRERSRNGVDTIIFETADDFFLEVTAFEPGRRDTPQSCVEDFLDDFDSELFEVTSNQTGQPIAGDTESGYFAVMSYDDNRGDPWALYVECVESPDGDVFVLFVGESPWDDAQAMIEAVSAIIDSIEF